MAGSPSGSSVGVGACTTALLIAIGQYLRAHPPQGYGVWLVFDDGEEAVKERLKEIESCPTFSSSKPS